MHIYNDDTKSSGNCKCDFEKKNRNLKWENGIDISSGIQIVLKWFELQQNEKYSPKKDFISNILIYCVLAQNI